MSAPESVNVDITAALAHFKTLRDFIRWGFSQFNQAELCFGHGTDNAWDEIINLVYASLQLPPDADQSLWDARLLPQEKILIAERIQSRIEQKIPVAYLVNEAWFAGLNFYVDKRVIIPRSSIGELIESRFSPWVEEEAVSHILDLCTGSGCIAIACAVNFPEAQVDAVDYSKQALEVAQLNVERFELEDNVKLIYSNLFEGCSGKKYDIIVSNPPYVPQSVYNSLPQEYTHEPKMALEAGEDGLYIVRRILQQAADFLTPKGMLIVEVGELQPMLEIDYPDAPFTWLQFEEGEDGVFLLTAEELKEFQHLWK